MAEIERTRERERPPLAANTYERIMQARAQMLERNMTGQIVIRKAERPLFQSRQGKLRYYLEPLTHPNTPLQMWRVFTHEIHTKSGKHRHQGGLVIYVLEGKGYSVVEGERIDWEKGDLVLLPLNPNEVEHQHFNPIPTSRRSGAPSSTCRSRNIWRRTCSRWKTPRISRGSAVCLAWPRHPEVRAISAFTRVFDALWRASKGDGPGRPSFEARQEARTSG